MNGQVKEKWLAALRSGKYIQGQMALHTKNKAVDKFCCLGVLCDIYGKEKGIEWQPPEKAHWQPDWTFEGQDTTLKGTGVDTWAELRIVNQNKLMHMNDTHGSTFAEIADYREAHL